MGKTKSRYLTPDHPSHGCDQAWFIFAVRSHQGPGFGRLVLVEAKSHAAVSFLERVCALGEDEQGPAGVSGTCELMSVHRQCPSIGIRSDLVEEVAFGDFALDLVDRERVERDRLAYEALQEALGSPVRPDAPVSPAPEEPAGADVERKRENAVSALVGLGVSRAVAGARLKRLGSRIGPMPLDQIIVSCLGERAS